MDRQKRLLVVAGELSGGTCARTSRAPLALGALVKLLDTVEWSGLATPQLAGPVSTGPFYRAISALRLTPSSAPLRRRRHEEWTR